jgi:CRP-like cAMP-binding protein
VAYGRLTVSFPEGDPTAVAREGETGNRLLDRLPPAIRAELVSAGRETEVKQREILWEPGQSIPSVYFPRSGVVSLLAVTGDGASVEVATIGSEGMAGVPVFLGQRGTAPGRAMAQISGRGILVDADPFEAMLGEAPKLDALLRRYTHALLVHITQGAVCNRMHTVVQRLARWILEMDDRIRPDDLPVTHEFLSQMLGVRRASVTDAITPLKVAKAISHERARIAVLNHDQLRQLACECYDVVRGAYDALLD